MSKVDMSPVAGAIAAFTSYKKIEEKFGKAKEKLADAENTLFDTYKYLDQCMWLPSHFFPYYEGGHANRGRNKECTATKQQAEDIVQMFLDAHEDKEEILKWRAMSKEERKDLTGHETDRLTNLSKQPNGRRDAMGKSYANWLAKQEKAKLEAAAEAGDAAAQQALDDAADLKTYTDYKRGIDSLSKKIDTTFRSEDREDVVAAFRVINAKLNRTLPASAKGIVK